MSCGLQKLHLILIGEVYISSPGMTLREIPPDAFFLTTAMSACYNEV